MAVTHHSNALEDALDRGEQGRRSRRPLWVEEPVGRPRMPDPVRRAAVRAGLIVAFTLIAVNIAVLAALAEAWVAAPATLVAVLGTILATWAVLDVWVTRQVYIQRHGVVSNPSSAARDSRRARAREQREAERRRRDREKWERARNKPPQAATQQKKSGSRPHLSRA